MQVQGIKTNAYNMPDVSSQKYQRVHRPYVNLQNLQSDIFIKQTKPDIQFTGGFSLESLIIRYLKNKSYANSIRGSKRPYLSIDPELKDIINQVQIKVSKDEEIMAWDMNPKNANKYIIFLHGFSQNITNNQPLYKKILEGDYGLLAIDYRSYGKNPQSKHVTENDIMQDVKAAVKYLQGKNINNIGLVGHSFGSYIAAKTSNLSPFNFQVLVSPMLSLEFWLKNVLKHPDKYKNESMLIKYIPRFKEQYAKIFDIIKHLSENHTPTVVIQAKKDRYVRTSKVNQAVKNIPNLKEYIVIETGGHKMDTGKIDSIKKTIDNL